ncbi:hypothetical protein DUI87_21361 [Hirundo rustica rustica]|uniref:Uncharacterized protein n=1 Tax=Hirundo rustica rustica TaxID=333673 RepID=A0A3M0JSW4_HIRRU|nr:hypothetical protein DUI87_21361 [Hirundo rustica rustica]
MVQSCARRVQLLPLGSVFYCQGSQTLEEAFWRGVPVGLDTQAKLKKTSVILNPSLEEKSKEHVLNGVWYSMENSVVESQLLCHDVFWDQLYDDGPETCWECLMSTTGHWCAFNFTAMGNKIIGYAQLERTLRIIKIQLLALHKTIPKSHTMCLTALSKRFLDSVGLGAVITSLERLSHCPATG